jgi:hypothetical protein
MHELGHDFNAHSIRTGNNYGQPYVDLRVQGIHANDEMLAGNTNPDVFLADAGYVRRLDRGYQDDGLPWVQNTDWAAGEGFADMFANWVANSFTNDVYGTARYNWIESHMLGWIELAVSYNQ